jgi:hypothetical protein
VKGFYALEQLESDVEILSVSSAAVRSFRGFEELIPSSTKLKISTACGQYQKTFARRES